MAAASPASAQLRVARFGSALAHFRQHGLSRTALAFWMIVVSAQGAAVAYWIARTEQRAVALHRQLTRGQMTELAIRQGIVSDWSFRSALEARQREHRSRAEALRDSAARVRAEDGTQAGQFEMLAQQELLLAQLAGTLLMPFRTLDAVPDLGAAVDRRAADELARLGFAQSSLVPHAAAAPATAAVPAAPGAVPVAPSYDAVVGSTELAAWRPFSGRIHDYHHDVPRLALGVVLFVLTLVCLTTADLLRKMRRVTNVVLVLGAAASVTSLISVVIWDPSVWRPVGLATAFALLLTLIFRVTGLFGGDDDVAQQSLGILHHEDGETPHPVELEHRHFVGFHLALKHVARLREQILVALTAVIVLLSATVGWWFAQAQTHANDATHRAFASEVQFNQLDAERWLRASAEAITPTLELFQTRMRCAFATQATALPRTGAGPAEVARIERDRERDCALLKSSANLKRAALVERADFDSGDRPAPALFATVRNDGAVNAAQLFALADGYISEAESWEAKAVTFVLALTLFAISLYLINQAMGMGKAPASALMACFGVLLACGTFTHAVVVQRRPVMPRGKASDPCRMEGTSIEVAAAFYSRGRAVHDAATTGADYAKAADLYGCALDARADFARAHSDRAAAAAAISQGDVDSSYSNFPTRARVGEIQTARAEMLRELERTHWTPTPRLLNGHGFNSVLAALVTPHHALLDTGIAALERGITLGGIGTPAGVVDAVKLKSATADAVDVLQMLYTNLGLARLAKGDRAAALQSYRAAVDGLRLSDNPQLVASSLSDLNILEAYCDDLHGAGSAACREVGTGIDEARRLLLVGRSEAAAGPSPSLTNLQVWARASRVGWTGSLSGFEPDRHSFAVVWSVYSDDWKVWRVVQPLFRPIAAKQMTGLTLPQQTTLYEASPSYCMPPGTYRADFYLNGVRVPSPKPLEADVRGFRNYRSRELDVSACVPVDWTRSAAREAENSRYLVQGFRNKDGKSALYLFTLFTPAAGDAGSGASPLTRAWTLLKQLSTSPSDDTFYQATARFQGCSAKIAPGTVLHRSWQADDGLTHVAFVIGDFAPGGQACEVLESIGAYYRRDAWQLLDRPRPRPQQNSQ